MHIEPKQTLFISSNYLQQRHREAAARDSAAALLNAAPTLVELFARPRDVAASAFALAQLPKAPAAVLWVQDRMSALETGRPYGPGLADMGLDPARLILACGRHAADVLWTMEEGLKCPALGAVIGEIWGDPKALDFTATKRLTLRAERARTPVYLIRFAASATLSAARRRWRIAPLPATPHPHDPVAPGAPRWHAELFRARGTKPGTWEASYDREAHRLHLSAPLRDREVAAQDGPQQQRAAG